MYDVAVVGAGVAGLAACVFLRGQGLQVVCLDAHAYPQRKVGESLDWSSPSLLRTVGIDVDRLLADRIATYKKKIVVYERSRPEWAVAPPSPIRRSPLRFETVTVHVDRTRLDQRLFEHARALGATFIWERVARVHASADRVNGLETNTGRRVDARWYIDASGTARLFSRVMQIPVTKYGRNKVCLWTYFETPPLHEGTAFFVDNDDVYLRWTWDIPISPTCTSVGLIVPADELRERRRGGESLESVLAEELRRYPRFAALLDTQPPRNVSSTSFHPYVTSNVCGANWFMVGEAASMPDPLTGNGVTSAIRHARYATDAIRASGARATILDRKRRAYRRHVRRLGCSFNAHIERAIYRHSVRQAMGFRTATYVYTAFAFFMNALYTRLDPQGPTAMTAFDVLFAAARMWIAGWTVAARAVLWSRGR